METQAGKAGRRGNWHVALCEGGGLGLVGTGPCIRETSGVSISGLDSPTVLEMDALERGLGLLVNMQ